jgi:hypothetical protein
VSSRFHSAFGSTFVGFEVGFSVVGLLVVGGVVDGVFDGVGTEAVGVPEVELVADCPEAAFDWVAIRIPAAASTATTTIPAAIAMPRLATRSART